VRVAGNRDGASAPAYAIAFVDLRFDDGHVERWLGSGSIRDDPASTGASESTCRSMSSNAIPRSAKVPEFD
jgi:hypothetical protein